MAACSSARFPTTRRGSISRSRAVRRRSLLSNSGAPTWRRTTDSLLGGGTRSSCKRGHAAKHVQDVAVVGGTVKTHLTHIYDKLNIHSRTELLEIVYDAEAGRGRYDPFRCFPSGYRTVRISLVRLGIGRHVPLCLGRIFSSVRSWNRRRRIV